MVDISPGSVVLLEAVRALRAVLQAESEQRVEDAIRRTGNTPNALADEEARDTAKLFAWPTEQTVDSVHTSRLAAWVYAYARTSPQPLTIEGAQAIIMTTHLNLRDLEAAALDAWAWGCVFRMGVPPTSEQAWSEFLAGYAKLGVPGEDAIQTVRLAHLPDCKYNCRSLTGR